MQFFKRLELQGFKSFATKTVIDFLPGVTVIVGPNGSGKSNIFDAIRWVLGEQSAKSLRGTCMGDVIFNGSASLKAMGMAKVELVLNNSSRHLSLDFDEVSLARHLYRTGESEYLLNRTPCRLKDISTLLMDTGVGKNSYSVLEQGRVDAIINAKPLERRVIFDEAAGISRYKSQKEEALSKLARTEESLTRLADIIAEVRRQANSLKRQASKAERYKKLSAELVLLEKELLARQFRSLTQEKSAVEERCTALTQLVERLRERIATLEEQQDVAQQQRDSIHEECERAQSESYAVSHQLTELQGRINLLEQRIADAQKRRDSLAHELEELRRRLQELEQELAQLRQQKDTQQNICAELEAEYRARKAEHEALKAQCDAAGTEVAQLRQRMTDLQARRSQLDSERQVAHAMEQKLRAELEHCEAELGALSQQIEALAIERDERQSAYEEAQQLLDALRSDQAAKQREVEACEKELETLRRELATLQREEQVCRSRHDALVELQENFEGYYGGVREVMLRAKAGELRGVIGAVSTLLEAADEHELAIEVALGSQAQDIIVETADHAKEAIEWLKRSGRGRATFLPLDLIEPREVPARWEEMRRRAGVIGLASELVRYDPRLARAVSYLLGGVVVCRDLDTAVALKREGFRARFVTLEGELVVPQGAMTGGSVKSQGLLHRTREIRKLAEELKHIQQRGGELAARTEDVARQLDESRQLLEKLVRSAQQQAIEAAGAEKDFQVTEQKLREKRLTQETLERRRTQLEQERQRHRERQEKALAEAMEIAEEIKHIEAKVGTLEAQTSSRMQELAARGQELNELVVRMSTARERLKSLEDQIASRERERLRFVADETNRRSEREREQLQEEEARREIAALEAQMESLRQRQRDLSEKLKFETSRRETILLHLSKLGEEMQLVRRDLNSAENELHEEELRLAKLTERLHNYELQAQQKFHCTLDEIVAQLTEQWKVTVEEIAKPTVVEAEEDGAAVANETPVLGEERSEEEILQRIGTLREKIDSLGQVHVGAIDEYLELMNRYEFLTREEKDLQTAKAQLTEAIRSIDETTTRMFQESFAQIRENFQEMFRRLFGGGRADLVLTEESNVLDAGIDIIAQPPGKKPTHISLLSGGEKALTAIALLFGIFMHRPSPVCILDEIDAPLDDKNIERFKDLVRDFATDTQFIIITHSKLTMTLANTIYGVTMEEEGVSRIVSLRLDEYEESPLAREMVLTSA